MAGVLSCKEKGNSGESQANRLPGAKTHEESVPMWQKCLMLQVGRE